jgi:uncharacterized repeat protein (TIGR03809 family)
MTHRIDVARGRDIVVRWCALAEQRLEYLTELFETGRWRRFHSELEFLENIQEAKTAVETWRSLASREASPNNSAIAISWLGRVRTGLPQADRLQVQGDRVQVQQLRPPPADIPFDAPLQRHVSVGVPAKHVSSLEAPSAPDLDAPESAPALEIDAIRERYPLLRNAL